MEDLTQPGLTKPIETTLELPWVQDAYVADLLADFWLARWKQSRLEVEAVSWGPISFQKGQVVIFENHPVLANLGGESLLFRIMEKSYLLGDDQSSRVQIVAVEI